MKSEYSFFILTLFALIKSFFSSFIHFICAFISALCSFISAFVLLGFHSSIAFDAENQVASKTQVVKIILFVFIIVL